MPLSYRFNYRVYHLSMSRIHSERPGSDPSDHSIAAEVLVREEPDDDDNEEEDEREDDGEDDYDDKDEDGDSYSE